MCVWSSCGSFLFALVLFHNFFLSIEYDEVLEAGFEKLQSNRSNRFQVFHHVSLGINVDDSQTRRH